MSFASNKKRCASEAAEDPAAMYVLIVNAEEPSEVHSYVFNLASDTSKQGRWLYLHLDSHAQNQFHNLGEDTDGLIEVKEGEDEGEGEDEQSSEERFELILCYLRDKCTEENLVKFPMQNPIHMYFSIVQS